MNSDTKYVGDVNSGLVEADLLGFYIDAESKRIDELSKKAIYEGIRLVYDIREEKERQRVLQHVMDLRV